MSRALALVLLGITSTAQAQARWNVSFGAGGGPEIAHSRIGTTRERVSGLVFAGEGVAPRASTRASLLDAVAEPAPNRVRRQTEVETGFASTPGGGLRRPAEASGDPLP